LVADALYRELFGHRRKTSPSVFLNLYLEVLRKVFRLGFSNELMRARHLVKDVLGLDEGDVKLGFTRLTKQEVGLNFSLL